MRAQHAAARCAAFLLPLLAGVLIGCGSSAGEAGDRSVAGVRAAAEQFVADIRADHSSEACETFTAQARTDLLREPGGCVGSIRLLYLFLSKELNRWLTRVLPHITIQGDAAMFEGQVEALYEGGRWHLENHIW